MENYIVGLGEILFDCLPEGKKLGGAPANFAYHVSQFGLNGIAVSAIGKDDNGEEIKQILSGVPSLKYHLEEVDEATGTVQVTLNEHGVPQYDICLGVAYDNIPWTPAVEEIARNTRAVCFGSLAQRTVVSRQTIQKFLDTMPSLGSLKVFDINLRQQWYSREIIEESLERCNVLKINDDEVVIIAQLFDLGAIRQPTRENPLQIVDFEDQCRDLMRMYDLQMIILTCGAYGSYVIDAKGVSFKHTPEAKVADTVGAGDSFTGSFCAAILAGRPITEAHELAVDVSTFVCTQHGAMPQYPQELTERLK